MRDNHPDGWIPCNSIHTYYMSASAGVQAAAARCKSCACGAPVADCDVRLHFAVPLVLRDASPVQQVARAMHGQCRVSTAALPSLGSQASQLLLFANERCNVRKDSSQLSGSVCAPDAALQYRLCSRPTGERSGCFVAEIVL